LPDIKAVLYFKKENTGGIRLSKTWYLKNLMDWGHKVEFEISEIDLLFKVKMKSGDLTISGESRDFWQALAMFLENANFFVASLKIEEELKPLADMVAPGKRVELTRQNSSLSITINEKPAADPLAEALKIALA